MRLNDVQRNFKDTMLNHPRLMDHPPDDFAALFEVGNIPLSARLKVYRNNIVGGLADTIIMTYPIVEKLVGQEFMDTMTRAFVIQSPSEEGCLNTYGREFPDFIANFKPAESLPYLADVARLECAINEAHYASDDDIFTTDDLAKIQPDDLGDLSLFLRQSTHLVESQYPLTSIREFCLKDDQKENEEQNDDSLDNDTSDNNSSDNDTLDIDQGGEYLLIYRPRLEERILTLNEDDFFMFQQLHNQKPLGEAVETTLNIYNSFDFQRFLETHIGLETFSKTPANAQ